MIETLAKQDIDDLMVFFYTDRAVQQDTRFDFAREDIEKMLALPHIFQYVFRAEKNVVGYLCGYDMGAWGYLDVLLVKKSHRNKSIGSALIDRLIIDNPQWTIIETSCYAHDEASIEFVRNRGFNIEQTLRWFGKQL
jgi:ribosomal protein S18 acetylase RimI-like enzyme